MTDEKHSRIMQLLHDNGIYAEGNCDVETGEYLTDRVYIDGSITFDIMEQIVDIVRDDDNTTTGGDDNGGNGGDNGGGNNNPPGELEG